MQPYFFPYIGYWQLIRAADVFVLYDDVAYIKGGWINRNRILERGQAVYLTLETRGASPNRKINEVMAGDNAGRLIKTLRQNYAKAPCFAGVMPVLETLLTDAEPNLARRLENLIRGICARLGIDTPIRVSSRLGRDTTLDRDRSILDICARLNATSYVNAIGGRVLYDADVFAARGLDLRFLQPRPVEYAQFGQPFVPWLSIIDVMMFNPPEAIAAMLGEYDLVAA